MTIKKILSVMFLICMLLPVSCGFGSGGSNSSINEDKAAIKKEISDSVKKLLLIQDSLTNGLASKTDSLADELIQARQEIINLRSRINDLQKPNSIMGIISLGAFLISIIAVILLFVRTRKMLKPMDVSNIIASKMSENVIPQNLAKRLNSLEQNVSDILDNEHNSNSSYKRIGLIERRLTQLESPEYNVGHRLRGIAPPSLDDVVPDVIPINNHNTIDHISESLPNTDNSIISNCPDKVLYTDINSENYFTAIFNSQKETCVYKIICRSDKEGDFTLISLDKIQSSNGWQAVVDYETDGDCTMADAQNYTPIECGKCEKINDDTWKVTKNLKIKISR